MCDGDLNTPLTDVQLCMRQTVQKPDLSNINVRVAFSRAVPESYASEVITLHYLNVQVTRWDGAYNSLEELFDKICAYYTQSNTGTLEIGDGTATFG